MRQGLITLWPVLALSAVLAACQAPPPAPVIERDQPPSQRIDEHLVSRGETLYSIAWRYELDVAKLAAANGLTPPYTIHVGQTLTLDTSKAVPRRARRDAGDRSVTVAKSSRNAEDRRKAGSAGESRPSGSRATLPPQPSLPSGPWSWRWPVTGKVTREYDVNRVFKGINIRSSSGTAVKAAGPGVVVYAGSGLRGYGRLVIVKHSDVYLSAYAHNRAIFVDENQSVSQGETIAEVGGDPADRDRLYFEIRKNGKPVDPLRLLPRQ